MYSPANTDLWLVTVVSDRGRTAGDIGELVARQLNEDHRLPLPVVGRGVVSPQNLPSLLREAEAAENCAGLIVRCSYEVRSPSLLEGICSMTKPMLLWDWTVSDRHLGLWCRAVAARVSSRVGAVGLLSGHSGAEPPGRVAQNAADQILGCRFVDVGSHELVARRIYVDTAAIDELVGAYLDQYRVPPSHLPSGPHHHLLREAAESELAVRSLLIDRALIGLAGRSEALFPPLVTQRLLADGFAVGTEGDWRTCVLTRAMKVMARGLEGGTSVTDAAFSQPDSVHGYLFGLHGERACPSLAARGVPGQGPAIALAGGAGAQRLVFDAAPATAVNVGLADPRPMSAGSGPPLRVTTSAVELIGAAPDDVGGQSGEGAALSARVQWRARSDLLAATAGWLMAGGPACAVQSTAVSEDHLRVYADLLGLECVEIRAETSVVDITKRLRWLEIARRASTSSKQLVPFVPPGL